MTLTEKLLARAAGKKAVEAGENVWVQADILMTHDVCGPGTIGVFKREFGANAKVWDRHKVVIIPDHYIFTTDALSNRNVDILRQFVAGAGLALFLRRDRGYERDLEVRPNPRDVEAAVRPQLRGRMPYGAAAKGAHAAGRGSFWDRLAHLHGGGF